MEIEFVLPRGYVDGEGNVHRNGRMRLATVRDEILPNAHPKVQANESYVIVLLMARVITQLGNLPAVTPEVVEGMFAADMVYLEDLYLRLNSPVQVFMGATCPHCQEQVQLAVAPIGV